MDTAQQLELIAGLYRCQNCGRDVGQVRRVRGFRVCDECWSQIVEPTRPGYTGELDDELRVVRERFWGWYTQMQRRYPAGVVSHVRSLTIPQTGGAAYWPFCSECDAPTLEYRIGETDSLFGARRRQYCPRCEARHAVDSVWRMHRSIHPDWDDEEWLDLLNRSHPEAFEVGVLPDYWFELKIRAVQAQTQ